MKNADQRKITRAEINEQGIAQNLILKQSELFIVDASVIKAQRNRPDKDKQGRNTWGRKGACDGKMRD